MVPKVPNLATSLSIYPLEPSLLPFFFQDAHFLSAGDGRWHCGLRYHTLAEVVSETRAGKARQPTQGGPPLLENPKAEGPPQCHRAGRAAKLLSLLMIVTALLLLL